MTTKADFSEQEWDLIREAPVVAGTVVITADRGGMTRETFAMAKAYAEARTQHGNSELLDEIVSARPERDHTRHHSFDELKEHALQTIRDAVALLEGKASPDEVEDYRRFIGSLMDRVARRHEEHGTAISAKEQAAIDEITAALGDRVPDDARQLQTRWDSVINARVALQTLALGALCVALAAA